MSQIFARLIISMVSVSAAVRDTKEAACLPVPKAFSTSSFASTSLSLFSSALLFGRRFTVGLINMSRPPRCWWKVGGSGRCEKPENSQEVTFLRPTPQPAFKEVATQETGDLWFYIHFENMNIFYNWGGEDCRCLGKLVWVLAVGQVSFPFSSVFSGRNTFRVGIITKCLKIKPLQQCFCVQ